MPAPPLPKKFAPTLENLEALLEKSASAPHREEVSRALRSAVNRGGIGRQALLDPVKRGKLDLPRDTILDYSDIYEPYSHLSERELALPKTERGLASILPTLRSPNAVGERLSLLREGMDAGGHLWYNPRPLKQFGERYAPEVDIDELLRFVSPLSNRTPVDNEIMQGLFGRYFLKKHGRMPTQEELGQAIPEQYVGAGSSLDDRLRWARQFSEDTPHKASPTGELMEKPKLYPYSWAKLGDVRNPVVDSHILDIYGLSSGLGPKPKGALGLGMQYESLGAGVMPIEQQAGIWTGRMRRGYTDSDGNQIKGNPSGALPFVHALERLVGESAEQIEKGKTQHLIDILQGTDYPRHGPKRFQTGGIARSVNPFVQAMRSLNFVDPPASSARLAPTTVGRAADELKDLSRDYPNKYNWLAREYMRSKMPEEFSRLPMRRINAGSGRATFMLGDDYIAKLAKMPRGYLENSLEGEPYVAEAGLIPKLLWRAPEDEMAIMERVPSPKVAVNKWIRPLQKAVYEEPGDYKTAHAMGKAGELLDERGMSRLKNYNVLQGDFLAPWHWGFKQDVMDAPLQRRRGTLLDPGALRSDLTGSDVEKNFRPLHNEFARERLNYLLRREANKEMRKRYERLMAEELQNPNLRIPGFKRGGPVKLAGGGDPVRLLMMLNRAQKAMDTERTIRSAGQRIPLNVAVEDLRGLNDAQLQKLADQYSLGSRQGYRKEDLKTFIGNPEYNLGRIEELHDICSGPLGKRFGICFPERGFAGGGVVRNWLRGVRGSGTERFLEELKGHRAVRSAMRPEIEEAGFAGDPEVAKRIALRKWIDTNVANYITRQLGTEVDPMLAGMGPIEQAQWRAQIRKIPAADVQRSLAKNVYLNPQEQEAELAKNPWLQKLIEQDQPRAWSAEQHAKAIKESDLATRSDLSPITRHMSDSEVRTAKLSDLKDTRSQMADRARAAEDKYQRRFQKPIELYDIEPRNITSQWRDALDFLASQHTPEQLSRISVPQAMQGSKRWHEQLAKQKAKAMGDPWAGTKVHKEYPGGMRWVEIGPGGDVPFNQMEIAEAEYARNVVRNALEREGKLMGHCVGDYCEDVLGGGTKIYSLRSPKGDPHVTVEVTPPQPATSGPESRLPYLPNIQQIKGKGNKAPVAEYLPYVQDFIRSGKWGEVNELKNSGLIKAGQHYLTPEEAQSFRRYKFNRNTGDDAMPSALPTNAMNEDEAMKYIFNAFNQVVGDAGPGGYTRQRFGPFSRDTWMTMTEEEARNALRSMNSNLSIGVKHEVPESWRPGMAEGGLVDDAIFERVHSRYPQLPHGLLKSLAQAESNMNPKAVSHKGAQGLMQFMPRTAKQYGVDPWDVESSVGGAAKYLTDLNKRFGDWEKTLAAYNWGPGNLSTYGMEKAPSSTRAYIAKVLAGAGNQFHPKVRRALQAGLKAQDTGPDSEMGPSFLAKAQTQADGSTFDTSAQDEDDSLDEEALAYLLSMEESQA